MSGKLVFSHGLHHLGIRSTFSIKLLMGRSSNQNNPVSGEVFEVCGQLGVLWL